MMKLYSCVFSGLLLVAASLPTQAQSDSRSSSQEAVMLQCANNLQYQNGQYGNATFGTGIDTESAMTLCQGVKNRKQSAAVYKCANDGLYRNGFYNNPNYRTGRNINEVLELCEGAANANPAAAQASCLKDVQRMGVATRDGRLLCQQVKTNKQAAKVSLCLKEQLYDVGFYNNPSYRSTISLPEAVRSCTPE
jgi:hypothetical protein